MVRVSKSGRSGRMAGGWRVMALAAAALMAAPVLPAMADDDRGRGRDRDHGRYRDHDRGRDHGHRGRDHGHWGRHHDRHHHHDHHRHGHSSFRLHIGLGSYPTYVRERVIVREPVCPPPVIVRQPVCPTPVVVHQPAPVIIHQPAPVYVTPPPQVYVPAHTAPVIRTAPQQATVIVPSAPYTPSAAQPVAVATQTPIAVTVPPPPPADVVPAELSMSAYRAGDTIMVVVSGINAGGSFNTTLSAGDLHGESPVVVLGNTPVAGGQNPGETQFSVTTALHLTRAVSAVTVRIADKAYRVQIVDVPSLS